MPIIVEDGTVVPLANSYVTEAEVTAAATLYGVSLWEQMGPAGREAVIVKGTLVVNDGSIYVYDGERSSASQSLEYPRVGASYWRGGPDVAEGSIPQALKNAQINAILGLVSGEIVLQTAGGPLIVKSRTVDVLTTSYFSPSEAGGSAAVGAGGLYSGIGWPSVTGILAPLLDADYYDDLSSGSGKVSSATAARRGPTFAAPSYGGIWTVGQNDNS